MSRLIDVDAFSALMKQRQDAVKEWMGKSKDEKTCARAESAYVMLAEVKLTLDQMPTIDAVEVIYGEWLSDYDGFEWDVRCSVCGEEALIKEGGSHDHAYSNYCPNCGARMRGKEQNDE